MSDSQYFAEMKALARLKRTHYGVNTAAFGLRELRKIYKAESISLDSWPLPRKIKALYMCDGGDCSVAVHKTLPAVPKLFALVHELKHHYCDQEAIGSGLVHCGDYVRNARIEIGAEVFAAEFIYPESDFAQDIRGQGIAVWQDRDVVTFKRQCTANISYQFICKRLERLRLIAPGQFDKTQFQKLEDNMFGLPFYRQRRGTEDQRPRS
jgi:hypothetical protein